MAQSADLRPSLPAASDSAQRPALSAIVPFFNEAGAAEPFARELIAALEALGQPFEIVAVNDGSTDGTGALLDTIAASDSRFRVVHFRRNFGQTAALMAGFDMSRGEVLVTLDGDGQNDPADIGPLLAKLNEGFDVVSGWRRERRDGLLRRLPSRIANALISAMSGVHLRDYGCTLKAYRRSALDGVRLYGELHRFIPIFATWQGARVTELPTHHRPRRTGRSKYGLGRTSRVVLDMVLVTFLERAVTRPLHVFGGFGLLALLAAFGVGIWALWIKIFNDVSLISTPLPLLVTLLMGLGVSSVFTGLLAEMMMRTYYESQDKRPYSVSGTRNFGS